MIFQQKTRFFISKILHYFQINDKINKIYKIVTNMTNNNITKKELALIKKSESDQLKILKKIRNKVDVVKKWYSQKLEMYEKIVEHMSESIWVWSVEKWTIYANPKFCDSLWYKLDDILWVDSLEFWDDESRRTVLENRKLRTKWTSSKYEWNLLTKDGEKIPVLLSWAALTWWLSVWIMTDLREMKSLKKVEEDLKQLNKVKDEFLSIVWHELRTPLTVIKWYLNMVIDGDMWEINDNIRQALTASYESSLSMLTLINDMLDLSKIESWNMLYYDEIIDITDLSKKLYNDLDIIAREKWINLELIYKWDFKNKELKVDPNKLKQILINLINNALKFTNRWWYVKIIINDLWKSLLFEIEDSWIWISEEKLDKIFDKFFQVDSYKQRTVEWLGLWLAISQNIIKHYNSKIEVKSIEWVGTTFYFKLNKK